MLVKKSPFHVSMTPFNLATQLKMRLTDLNPEMQSSSRNEITARWGFTCACTLCRQSPDQIHASDTRLRMIAQARRWAQTWTELVPDRIDLAELIVTLYELEDLSMTIYSAYQLAAFAHSAAGNDAKTRAYAAKALEHATLVYGANHKMTKELETLLLKPSEHGTWLHDVRLEERQDVVPENWGG